MVSSNSGEMVGCFMVLLVLSSMLLQQAERVSAGCGNIQTTLTSCRGAVEGDNPPPPTDECCTVLEGSVGCLCEALAAGVLKNGNKQAAFMLPSKCKAAIPPGFNCADHEEFPIPDDR